MDNLSFLKEIITSNSQYWIAARKEEMYDTGGRKTLEDSIWIICIPHIISLFKKPNEILLTDVEQLNRCELNNIAISQPYAPFQHGISLYNFYRGFPLENVVDIKLFLIEALKLGSNNIWDYERLIKEMSVPETENAVA